MASTSNAEMGYPENDSMTIAGTSPFLIGNTSSNGWVSIFMLVFGGGGEVLDFFCKSKQLPTCESFQHNAKVYQVRACNGDISATLLRGMGDYYDLQ